MKKIKIGVIALAVTACNNQQPSGTAEKQESNSPSLSWKKAPENSFVHIDDDWAIKCWKKDQYQCLQVTDMTSKGDVDITITNPSYGLSRFSSATLPTNLDTNDSGGRYLCDYRGDSMSEYISVDGKSLTSNEIYSTGLGPSGEPWSGEQVSKYFKDNGISDISAPYLACSRVGGALSKGSLDSLATTSVSWDDVTAGPLSNSL